MPTGLLTMSDQEIERLAIIRQVSESRLKQTKASKLLDLSTRQIRRLVRKYRTKGAAGLVSVRRGKMSNRYRGDEFKDQIKQLVSQHYYDFGPTFAAEKLFEVHGLKISKERLRHWMIEWELWHAKHEKVNIHQTRERRACFGELIQIDGSHHDWFEGRGPKCCLLVFIDDATSKIVGLRFESQETTAGYFKLTRQYIEYYGRPFSFYSDKDSIFRINRPGILESEETQFGRAMRELGIETICANSPQAKGRVERVNKTLQKRLVRELRLRGISDIKSANAYLPEYLENHNRRFAKEARNPLNKHTGYLPLKETLDLIFTFQEERTLSKNLELSYYNLIYQICGVGVGHRLQHKKVMVCEDLNGRITLLQEGRRLEYKTISKQERAAKVVPLKQLDEALDHRGMHPHRLPSADHPWRQYKQTTGVVYKRHG